MPFDTATMAALTLLATVAGLVRGFAGFGGALIFVPLASAMVGPQVASVIVWTADTIPSLPIVAPALRRMEWRSVWPVFLGNSLTVGIGVWWLATGDPLTLRWVIFVFIIFSVAVLLSGWRYHGNRPVPLSLAVGGVSGFFGGAAQVSGPPVLIYWLAGQEPAALIRANVISLFFFTTITTGLALWAGDLFTRQAIMAALVVCPAYGLAMIVGQKFFDRSSDQTFRRLAFGLILLSAITSMPVLDGVLR